jgi:hypothetical protein
MANNGEAAVCGHSDTTLHALPYSLSCACDAAGQRCVLERRMGPSALARDYVQSHPFVCIAAHSLSAQPLIHTPRLNSAAGQVHLMAEQEASAPIHVANTLLQGDTMQHASSFAPRH